MTHQRLMQRSVLTLTNFSKTYDTVWRGKLPIPMLHIGIPSTFVRCIQSFSNNHRTRVQLFHVFSSSHHFTQSLPQGSLLAPLLFLFYINTLASSLNEDAVIALFANDSSYSRQERRSRSRQSAVNSVLIWSQEWKLNLNAHKSEVYPFSTWSNDST